MKKRKIDPILDRLRDKLGVRKDTDLCRKLDISYGTLDNWKSRDNIPIARLKEFARMLDVSLEWLETGEGEMHAYKASIVSDSISEYGINNITCIENIPIVSAKASAGNGNNVESIDVFDTDRYLTVDKSIFKTPPSNRLHAIQVDGYSMVPVLLPDSWVIFEDSNEYTGDGLYVLVFRNVLMVKLIEADPKSGSLWIKSANKDYDDWEYDPTQDQSTMKIVGRVVRCII